MVKASASEMSADVAEVGTQRLDFLVDLINGKDLDAVLKDSY